MREERDGKAIKVNGTNREAGGTAWLEDPWSKKREGPDSGTEPYDARVSRTVPLRRV